MPSAHSEARLSRRLLVEHLGALDKGAARALAHPRHHAVNGPGFALEHRLHGAVVAVANPSGDACGGRHALAAVPEENALDASVHHHPPSHRHRTRPYARPSMEVLSGRIILRPVDLERSLRFYGQTLGLKIYREYGTGTDRGVVLFIGGGYLEITGRAPPVDVDKLSLWLQVPDLDDVYTRL